MQETEGIILRTYKLREQDKICVVLTKKLGKIRGVFHNPSRRISTNGIYEEPFSEIRLQVYGREGQQRVTLSTENWIAADGTPLCRNCGGQYGEYLGLEDRTAWASVLAHSPGELPA